MRPRMSAAAYSKKTMELLAPAVGGRWTIHVGLLNELVCCMPPNNARTLEERRESQ